MDDNIMKPFALALFLIVLTLQTGLALSGQASRLVHELAAKLHV